MLGAYGKRGIFYILSWDLTSGLAAADNEENAQGL